MSTWFSCWQIMRIQKHCSSVMPQGPALLTFNVLSREMLWTLLAANVSSCVLCITTLPGQSFYYHLTVICSWHSVEFNFTFLTWFLKCNSEGLLCPICLFILFVCLWYNFRCCIILSLNQCSLLTLVLTYLHHVIILLLIDLSVHPSSDLLSTLTKQESQTSPTGFTTFHSQLGAI